MSSRAIKRVTSSSDSKNKELIKAAEEARVVWEKIQKRKEDQEQHEFRITAREISPA